MSQKSSKATPIISKVAEPVTTASPTVVDIRMPMSVRTDEVVDAFTQLCHKFNLTAKIRGESKRGAPRSNPEGEIVIHFADSPLTKSIKDARTARKWLRKHQLSVTTAVKVNNQWTFKSISAAAKLSLTQKVVKPDGVQQQ